MDIKQIKRISVLLTTFLLIFGFISLGYAQDQRPGPGMGPGMGMMRGYGPGWGEGYTPAPGLNLGNWPPGMGYGRGPDEYGYHYDRRMSEICNRFLDQTSSLRKSYINATFDYLEAMRNPNTTSEALERLLKQQSDLYNQIRSRNSYNCWW